VEGDDVMYVLIVEDDAAARRALELLLADAGHTICWAETAEGAIRLLRTEKVDLILLDIVLRGDTDGLDVLHHKLSEPSTVGIPVIIMTGLTTSQIHERAHREWNAMAGAMVVMGKPLDGELLMRAIESLKKT
jgi:CheY-like chemotaxis protein